MRRTALLLGLTLIAACSGVSPYAISKGFVLSAEGLPIAYASSGAGNSTLVFIHGWSCDRRYWLRQARVFSVHHRVVLIDLPGHGESGDGRAEWTLEAYGEDVADVVEALELDNVVLVGHSMGAPVALEAARRLPRRVVGVVGVDSLHDADSEFDHGPLIRSLEQDFVTACGSFIRDFMFLPDADPEQVRSVVDAMCSADPAIALALMRRFPAYDLAAALAAVEVPVRVVNAARYPTNVEANRKYADFDAVTMDGVGHFPMLEEPREFNRRLADVVEGILDR